MSSHELTPKIKKLPTHLIDQIKAGEVVERPASLLKELLENSIDAQATKIEIRILGSGLDLIAISDNGHGMTFEDLPLAFDRHATSKIRSFDDLFNLSSFGFRGEALASIASISRVTCTSVTSNGQGGKIILEGGETLSHTPILETYHGTSIFIKDLFFNTPARLKFAKSKTAEKSSLLKMIHHYLIAYPHIHFLIQFDNNDQENYLPKNQLDHLARIEEIFFKRKEEKFHHFDRSYEGYRAFGYVSTQGGSGKNQFLFANNRPISDKSLHALIINLLKPIWPFMQGHYFIFLQTPCDEIDVNVHPNKTQVKFSNASLLFGLLSSTIKEILTKSLPASHPAQTFDQPDHDSFTPNTKVQIKPFHLEGHNLAIRISDSFFLYLKDNQTYLVDEESLLTHLLDQIMKNTEEENSIPLLVAPPIYTNHPVSLQLKRLHASHFALDQVSENSLILRAIPRDLFALPYLEIITAFLNGTSLKNILNPEHIEEIFQKIPPTELLDYKIMKPLDNNSLKKFLNET